MPLNTSFLRTYAETHGFMLGRPWKARPVPGGEAVLFLRAEARVPRLRFYEYDVALGQARELLKPEDLLKGAEERLSPEEKAHRERMRVSVGGFTDYQLSPDGSLVHVSLSGKLYVVRRPGGEVRELVTGPGNLLDPKFSPDGNLVAYVRGHDLFIYDLSTQTEHPLTSGGSEQRTHGLAEFVAQEEMERFSGYWWSPDSRSVAYEEADATGVEVRYLADPAKPGQPPLPFFYPRPGKPNVLVRLGVVPVQGGDTVWVSWDGERYPYLGAVRWDKEGPLTLAVQTRDQKELVLLKADPATGKAVILLTERDPQWVNLCQDVPAWLGAKVGFLWVSERDGAPQLEIRDPAGPMVRVLVPPAAGFQKLADVDAGSGRVVYQASPDPTRARLFSLSLSGGPPKPLSTEPGQASATFARDHGMYVQQYLSQDRMPRTTVHRADGRAIGELPSVAVEPPLEPRAKLVKVGNGPGFFASLIRPDHFDPAKRYPVLVDVYGGPRHNKVTASLASSLLAQWLADQGFVVVSIDGRGTPGRGHDWERAVFRRFGSVPLEDQVAGVKALGERFPEMDLDRVGIVGWSFGGYLSALAVLRRPDVFKAAVAGAPVVDWLDYDSHYTERYLGLPDADPAGYQEASLLTYAAGLERPLLLVHGTADDNVYFQHTLKLADALLRAGKDFEVLPLTGLTHMVRDPGVAEQLWIRIASFFRKHLGNPAG